MRSIPCELSSRAPRLAAVAGSVKLGQPVPESNFVSDENSSAPQAAQWYVPLSLEYTYSPLNGRSVPRLRRMSYCSGVSLLRNSASVSTSASDMTPLSSWVAARQATRWRANLPRQREMPG